MEFRAQATGIDGVAAGLLIAPLAWMAVVWWLRRRRVGRESAGHEPEDRDDQGRRIPSRLPYLVPFLIYRVAGLWLSDTEVWPALSTPLAVAGFGMLAWIGWRDWTGPLRDRELPWQGESSGGRLRLRLAWLAAALLAPAAVLGVLAGRALNREWLATRNEAATRATQIAGAAVERIGGILDPSVTPVEASGQVLGQGGGLTPEVVTVDAGGALLDPGPVAWPPRPHPFTEPLTPVKRRQWEEAIGAFHAGEWKVSADRFEDFLERRLHPGTQTQGEDKEAGIGHPRYRGIALFHHALARERAVERDGEDDPTAGFLRVLIHAVVAEAPNLLTESGVPVVQLAALRLLEEVSPASPGLPWAWSADGLRMSSMLGRSAWTPYLDAVFERMRGHAEALVPGLEAEVADRLLRTEYDRRQRLRRLHADAAAQSPATPWPAAFWFDSGQRGWLASRVADGPDTTAEESGWVSRRYLMVDEERLRSVVSAVLTGFDPRGEYVVNLDLAGRRLAGAKSDGVELTGATWLARLERGDGQGVGFQVAVALADPTAFYASGVRRVQWLAWLLVGTLAASWMAVMAMRGAVLRQHALSVRQANFVSAVSHELRAPLGSIRLLAEGLERGVVSDEARRREYVHLIGQETRRLGGLVENILDLSRIEQGRQRYEWEPTDLRQLVDETVKAFGPLAAQRQVSIDWNPPPAGPDDETCVDGRSVQQALLNLLDNALKHSPRGEAINVSLGLRPAAGVKSDDARPAHVISVSDRGPGIQAEDRHRIFEPFFRCGSELTRSTQGIGIGLTIVRHVVQAHGGRVEVECPAGQGTVFRLILPRPRSSAS